MQSKGSLNFQYRTRKQAEREVQNVRMAVRILKAQPHYDKVSGLEGHRRKIAELKNIRVRANRSRDSLGSLF